MDKVRELVSRRIQDLGLSMADVSRKCGRNASYIQQYLTKKSPKILPEDVRITLSRILKVSIGDLSLNSFSLHRELKPPHTSQEGLRVIGEVAAGVWLEEQPEEETDDVLYGLVRDPRFPNARQFALRLRGDSCDLYGSDGDYVVCVDAYDIGRSPQHNDFVIAVRSRMNGQIRETTCKQVEIREGRIELWPRSRNPKYQEPIILAAPGEEDHTEVEITAYVLSFQKRVF